MASLVDAGLVEGLLDENGRVGDARSLRCVWPVREIVLEGGESCPAVQSRDFRWTDHVYCMKQETFLSGV